MSARSNPTAQGPVRHRRRLAGAGAIVAATLAVAACGGGGGGGGDGGGMDVPSGALSSSQAFTDYVSTQLASDARSAPLALGAIEPPTSDEDEPMALD